MVVPPHFATRARAALGARSRERTVGAWGRAAAVLPRARESLHLRVGGRPCTWWAALWAPDGRRLLGSVVAFSECNAAADEIRAPWPGERTYVLLDACRGPSTSRSPASRPSTACTA